MDISELLIEVKNTNRAVNQILKVNKALKNTNDSAKTLGKTILSGFAFTKLISQVKKFGDSWKNVLVTFRNFKTVFGQFNIAANKGMTNLIKNFNQTEAGAKKLLSSIGSKLFDFDLTKGELGHLSSQLASISQEIAAFYQIDPSQVADKLALALSGNTKSLREFGILIDQNGPKIKQLMSQLQLKGYDEKTARALAIMKELVKQSSKFEGSFKNQSKGISQAISDLSNTLNDKIFSRIGENLSKIFVPALEKLNELLSNQKVADIAGLVGTILTIGAALAALASVAKNLKFLIGGTLLSSFGKSILLQIGAMLMPILVKIGTVIASITAAIVAGIAAIPASVIIAITAALAVIGTLIYNKIKTGSFFDFSALTSTISGWLESIANFFERSKNWFNGKGFNTEAEYLEKRTKEIEDYFNKVQKDLLSSIQNIKSIIDDAKKKIKGKTYRTITSSDLSKMEKSISFDIKQFERLKKKYNMFANYHTKALRDINHQIVGLNALIDQIDKQVEQIQNLPFSERISKIGRVTGLLRLKRKFQDQLSALNDEFQTMTNRAEVTLKPILNDVLEQAKNSVREQLAYNQYKKLFKENVIKRLDFISDIKDFTVSKYKELASHLVDFGKLSKKKLNENVFNELEKKIKRINLTIKAIEDLPEEQKRKYKDRLVDLYKQLMTIESEKANLEYDNLSRQKQLLEQSNQMILGYMEKIAQWSPQGIEGVRADSAEGYKMMTSSFGTLNSIKPAIQAQTKDQKTLQQKANKIAEKTGQKVAEIYEELKKLIPKVDVIEVQM